MDASRIATINVLHSIILAGISYWEFKDTIQASPEIYFTMFLALIALTFSNNIRSGNIALTKAASLFCVLILIMQIYYSIDVLSGQFILDKIRKLIMIFTGLVSALSFIVYLRRS